MSFCVYARLAKAVSDAVFVALTGPVVCRFSDRQQFDDTEQIVMLPLRVIDLFSGCGGMSLGFHRAGYQILGGVEWDQYAAATHARNFFSLEDQETVQVHAQPRDITRFGPADFLSEVLGGDDPADHVDVIVGGPPCQAFARIGRAKLREILRHPQAYLRDGRANMYLHYLEYVEFFRPKAVVMENVPDIMNFGGKNVAEEIASSLEDLGYRTRYTILNAAHYGVPELRQRFFLMAIRNDLDVTPEFPVPTHQFELTIGYASAQRAALQGLDLFNYQEWHYVPAPTLTDGLPSAVTAQQALEDLPVVVDHLQGLGRRGPKRFQALLPYRQKTRLSDYARLMREWPGFAEDKGVTDQVTRQLPRDYPIFKRMRHGDEYPEALRLAERLFETRLRARERKLGRKLRSNSAEYQALRSSTVPPYDPGKFRNKWCKIDPDRPVRTLTAHIGKDTYSHIHFDSRQARTITVREAARLQSFPDGFRFCGAMNAAFRQIGNAVPPLQAYALAMQVRKLLMHTRAHTAKLETRRVRSTD